jgi:hypothetical protein
MRKPEVTSIYDKMPFSAYRGIPLVYIYHFDVGFLKWCIENREIFCIKEWDYIKELSTFNKKSYIPDKEFFRTQFYPNPVQEYFSDVEILRFLGGEPQDTNDWPVNDANTEKLEKFGITSEPPKLFDRTYLSYHWSFFPRLSGNWEFEGFEYTSKDCFLVNLKKTNESMSNLELRNNKLSLIVNAGPFALFKDKEVLTSYPEDFFQTGELVTIISNPENKLEGEQYLICKL